MLEPSALRIWPAGRNTSIEKEIFPRSIQEGAVLRGFESDAYWLDLGTPEQYLRAHVDLLEGRVGGSSYPAPWIGSGASLDPTARIERSVAIGDGAQVGPEAHLVEAVLMAKASVEANALVERTIVGARGVVGEGAMLVDSVLGDGARVPPGARLEGVRMGSGTPSP